MKLIGLLSEIAFHEKRQSVAARFPSFSTEQGKVKACKDNRLEMKPVRNNLAPTFTKSHWQCVFHRFIKGQFDVNFTLGGGQKSS